MNTTSTAAQTATHNTFRQLPYNHTEQTNVWSGATIGDHTTDGWNICIRSTNTIIPDSMELVAQQGPHHAITITGTAPEIADLLDADQLPRTLQNLLDTITQLARDGYHPNRHTNATNPTIGLGRYSTPDILITLNPYTFTPTGTAAPSSIADFTVSQYSRYSWLRTQLNQKYGYAPATK